MYLEGRTGGLCVSGGGPGELRLKGDPQPRTERSTPARAAWTLTQRDTTHIATTILTLTKGQTVQD